MTPEEREREEQIEIALKHMKYKLKLRGDDVSTFNPKYLRDKATELVDTWIKENPGKIPYRKLGRGE